MEIRCIPMHPVTLVAIVIELIMLGAQLALLLNRPQDSHRFWYVLLLVWLVVLNITDGLLPNPAYNIPIYTQNIISYGVGFGLAAYFPFYFYKAFDLKGLRFHALYGVALFLLLPYLSFFLVSYSIHEDLRYAQRWGFIIPFIYSGVLLVAILKAIRAAYRENRDHNRYVEEIAVFCAVAPWSFLVVIIYFEWGRLTETMFTNLGFLAVTAMFIFKSVRRGRADLRELSELKTIGGNYSPYFQTNCIAYGLTQREAEIASLIRQGLRNKAIADGLHISEGTVKKHIENMFHKTGAVSRLDLVHRLVFTPAEHD